MQERSIDLRDVQYMVLDEVDRMLDMGFVDDIKEIRDRLPPLKQTYMFSATYSSEIMSIINAHLKEYEFIKTSTELMVAKIQHHYLPTHDHEKFEVLNHLLKIHDGEKIIIFTQMKRTAQDICDDLRDKGIKALPLHGDLEQRDRMRVMKAFKAGEMKVLVTTDVAARGLNMDNVNLVINYDVPNQAENYIHRVGRTGRAGAEGKAIMFVSPNDLNFFKFVMTTNKINIDKSEHNHLTTYDFEAQDLLQRRGGG
jgi:superfamily II DNA/RNA helicase